MQCAFPQLVMKRRILEIGKARGAGKHSCVFREGGRIRFSTGHSPAAAEHDGPHDAEDVAQFIRLIGMIVAHDGVSPFHDWKGFPP